MSKCTLIILCITTLLFYNEGNAQKSDSIAFVKINKQVWMSRNLDISHFSNGVIIPKRETIQEWKDADLKHEPAWCYYNNDSLNGYKFGKLYNWWVVIDPQHICPSGWRVPDDKDWQKLIDHLGGKEQAGASLKSKMEWMPDDNGNDETGFSALPGGFSLSLVVLAAKMKGDIGGLGIKLRSQSMSYLNKRTKPTRLARGWRGVG
jgi:uncharacterized protein (TIGR02145 family)